MARRGAPQGIEPATGPPAAAPAARGRWSRWRGLFSGRRLLPGHPRLRIADPGLVALRNAVRAAVVLPAVFALAGRVIEEPGAALFASFGSFAMLVFADFTGPPRNRLIAYLGLAVAGAAFISGGTLASRDPLLAAVATGVAAFVILFSGVINGYFAAAATAAILVFVVPVTIPAPAAVIPARLTGWALAAGAGVAAQLLLWPVRRRTTLRHDAARACTALADLAETQAAERQGAKRQGADEQTETRATERTAAARAAVDRLRRRFVALPQRPTGLTRQAAALTSLVDELDWLLSFLCRPAGAGPPRLCREENAAAVRASAAALRSSAALLRGHPAGPPPDLRRLDETREAMAHVLAQQLPALPAVPDHQALVAALQPTFRTRAISYAARESARYAILATGGDDPEGVVGPPVPTRPGRSVVRTTELAIENADVRSVWFRNSIRGAVGLAIAVYVAQRTGLQHSFWVVLGTLSVLRSNALGTGRSIVSALAGTSLGILVGAPLILLIGTHRLALWSVLPVAVLIAAYAPQAISFAAGQAAFTVVVFILFTIIQPSGWEVGLMRIEDAAIGFAISLLVGFLFWPRGAAALLRENLAAAYARGGDYVLASARRLLGHGDPAWSERSAQDADAAVRRLGDAFRQYLSERSARSTPSDSLAALVTGAARVRRVGRSLAALEHALDGRPGLIRCGANLDAEIYSLRTWYLALGDCLLHDTEAPPPHVRDTEGRRRLLECVRAAVASGDEPTVRAALALLWTDQYLENLWTLEGRITRHAAECSGTT